MRPPLLTALLAAVLAMTHGACGGEGDNLIDEDSLRDCLANAGLSVEGTDLGSSAALGNVSPDFRAITEEGVGMEVVVQGNVEKTERTAADIRGALASFGAAGSVVVSNKNAIVIFEEAPTSSSRGAVEACLGVGE